MTCSRRSLATILALLVWTAPALAAPGAMMAGNEQVVWAMVVEDGQWTPYRKSLGKNWQKLREEPLTGEPMAIAASGPQLGMILKPGQVFVLDSSGALLQQRNPTDVAQWPLDTRDVALADARNLTVGDDQPLRLLALVARPAPPEPAPTPEQADDQAAEAAEATESAVVEAQDDNAAKAVTLGLIGYSRNQWAYLGDVSSAKLTELSSLHLVVHAGRVFVVISQAEGGRNRLLSVTLKPRPDEQEDQGTQEDQPPDEAGLDVEPVVEQIPLEDDAASSVITSAVAFPGQLVMTLLIGGQPEALAPEADQLESLSQAQPSPEADIGRMHLWIRDLASAQVSLRAVSDEDAPFDNRVPSVGRLGDNLTFLWRSDETWHFAKRTLAGELIKQREVEAFNAPPPTVDAQELIYYVLMGSAVLIMTLVTLRPRRPIKPFMLPAGVNPAPLALRGAAFLIDALPLTVLAALVFPFDAQYASEHPEQVAAGEVPNLIYWHLAWVLGYVACCIVAEGLYGRTLGKRILHMQIVGNEGAKASWREAALRNVSKVIVLLLLPYALLLLLLPIINRYRQRVGDILASTTVVDERTLTAVTLSEASERSILDASATGAEAPGKPADQLEEHDQDQQEKQDQPSEKPPEGDGENEERQ